MNPDDGLIIKKGSELRKDIVSGDWILFAPARGKRPNKFLRTEKRKRESSKDCHFEPKLIDAKEIAIESYPDYKNWKVKVIPNKYPAVVSVHDIDHEPLKKISSIKKVGPYETKVGYGHHDIIVTRNHHNGFPELSLEDASMVMGAFKDRYTSLLRHKNIAYVGMFHNFGPKAGATVYHPHYQILAVAVVPPDVQHSLQGSLKYFKKYKKCVHCVMLSFEKADGKRIIFENESAIVFAPFVSRSPFEIRVFPKKHYPYFEDTPPSEFLKITEALQESLKKLKNTLDPDYNFFIHTAPILNKKKYNHYHWHIEVLPKLTIPAGFELQTGMDINVADPDDVASFIA